MTSRSLSVIPAPRSVRLGEGVFRPRDARVLCHTPEPLGAPSEEEVGAYTAAVDLLVRTLGVKVQPPHGDPSDAAMPRIEVHRVTRLADTDLHGEEAYTLDIRPDGVTVKATHAAGIARATATLRQLGDEWPVATIHDAPAFAWRGLLLDCCRHFLDLDYVIATVDRLAFHKMNRLHWHLTEDQGWRLEVRAFPRLTEVGAWRTGKDGVRHGGFYTQEEARAVVESAAQRGVTVVPEVELPGHALAALASYPELSCTGGPFEVETRWGIFDDVYCAGNERTFEFLEAVFEEVLDVFPGEFVHVGGDECPKARWKQCERCQARIRDEGLPGEDELQSYFIRRMEEFLRRKGRRLIGWDEILEGGLAPGATVQSWQGMDGAIAAVRAGQDAVVSPTSHAYLDYGLDRIDLRKAFEFDPVPPGLSDAERAHILGGECNMWTERAPQDVIDQKIYPRLLAFAERLWTGTEAPAGGNAFEEFHARVQEHYPRLRALGIDYGKETA